LTSSANLRVAGTSVRSQPCFKVIIWIVHLQVTLPSAKTCGNAFPPHYTPGNTVSQYPRTRVGLGYVGLCLGPQDPRRPSANCGTHGVNRRFMNTLVNFRQNFMSSLFTKLSFILLIRFRVDNARVFQRVSVHLSMTVGQAACLLLWRQTQSTLATSCVWWITSIV